MAIHILDENDNAPEFSEEFEQRGEITINFQETDPPGSFRFIQSAKDADLDLNSQISYRKTKEYLTVNQNSNNNSPSQVQDSQLIKLEEVSTYEQYKRKITGLKLVLNRPIDREQIRFIHVEINATDSGNPPLSSLARIRINVLDVNDNAPTFKNSTYFINLSESFPLSTKFLNVEAIDKDSEDGNGLIRYSINEINVLGLIVIEYDSGDLKLIKQLDYEKEKLIRLVVFASDQGIATKLTGTTTVFINVLDENDNTPDISRVDCNEFITIKENIAPTIIQNCKYLITDEDSGRNGLVKCRILENNTHFELVTQTNILTPEGFFDSPVFYSIKTTKPLDRESSNTDFNGMTSFTIFCEDNPIDSETKKTSSLEIKVLIEDENDWAPKIKILGKENLSIEISETDRSGAEIGTVQAIDLDSGLYNVKNFSSIFKKFNIDSTRFCKFTNLKSKLISNIVKYYRPQCRGSL